MKKIFILFFCTSLLSCNHKVVDPELDRISINATLDRWHEAAAKPDYNGYFSYMSEDAVFIGTDATENWNKHEFMVWSKPFFDKGKAWSFTSLERNIFFDETGKMAWFDELLNTQMKICRGSGVMVKKGDHWKIQHYVLSMTIPNELVDTIVKLKTPPEEIIIRKLSGNQ